MYGDGKNDKSTGEHRARGYQKVWGLPCAVCQAQGWLLWAHLHSSSLRPGLPGEQSALRLGGLPKVMEHRLAPERQSQGSRIPPAPLGFFSWAPGLVERHKANLILSRLLASEMTLVTESQ